MNILELKHVTQKYKNRTVINVPYLALTQNKIIGLYGPNGAGKSTLLRIMALLEKPSSGEVIYKGKKVFPFSKEAREITLLTQQPYLLKRSVFENVAYGLKIRGLKKHLEERVYEALDLVGLDKSFAKRPWYALSGGEAQRVALASRLILKPKILLLDEPTASVDLYSAQLIKEAILKAVKSWDATLVIASHDRPWLNEICKETWHVLKGHVFAGEQKNFIFGPWIKKKNKLVKRFKDGQEVAFQKPLDSNEKDIAVIETTKIKIVPSQVSNSLFLEVSQISLGPDSKSVLVSLRLEDFSLSLSLTREKISELSLLPGKKCYVSLPHEVKWL
ncbi:energy-coupling factor ABC transporter ATP-binding protein [Thermodesulfatator atlanticus]